MKLENGYKVLYATPVKDETTGKVVEFSVSASDTGLFEDAKEILTVAKDAYKLIYRNEINSLYSHINKIKEIYVLPSQNINYYHQNAFKTNFKFNDEIIINGEKVIFK